MRHLLPVGVLEGLLLATLILMGLSAALMVLAVVSHAENTRRRRRRAAIEARFKRPVLDLLSGDREPGFLPRDLGARDTLELAEYLAGFARRVGPAERRRLHALAAPLAPALRAMSRSRSATTRGLAVRLLAALRPGDTWTQRCFVDRLDDPVDYVATLAAEGLAAQRQAEGLAEILSRLPRFQHWNRGFAVGMLAGFGDAARPPLRGLLARGDTPWLRDVAARVLAALGDLEAAPLAAARLAREEDDEARIGALTLLARVGGPAGAAAVRDQLGHPTWQVRLHAYRAYLALAGGAGVARAAAGLGDPSPWVRLECARLLSVAGPEGVAELRAAAEGPGSGEVREVLEGAAS